MILRNIERKREKADNTKMFAKRLLHLILVSIGRDFNVVLGKQSYS